MAARVARFTSQWTNPIYFIIQDLQYGLGDDVEAT